MKKWTLGRKILAGFIACTAILITVAVFSFRNSEKFIETNKWVNHTHEVISEFDQLLASTIDVESTARGYVIIGDDNYLEPFYNAKKSVAEHFQKVKTLTEDNEVQQKNLDDLHILINELLEFKENVVTVKKTNSEEAYRLVATGKGRRLLDEIRKDIANCKSIENGLLVERTKSSEKDASSFIIVFLVLLLIIAVVLISVYMIITSNLRALRKAEIESADKNWILAGSVGLGEIIRGEREIGELSQSIMEMLCNYLNAQIGVMYVMENAQLSMTGSYAYDIRKQNKTAIAVGEGLVGQAAREKKIIVFTEVPEDYIRINSGLGNRVPTNLVIIPLLQSGAVRGVIEIGMSREFSEREMQFIQLVGETVAIVINSTQTRSKLQELLEETQRQAEELETQQEELKQANEELQEKTFLLEKSEAELKAQQEELQQTNEELEEKALMLEEQRDRLENAKMDVETKARELEQTSKYKSEFLANMSHELRTPLNSILILSQLLAENKSKTLGDKEVEFSRNIYNSGTDLLNLINEILDLSKVESGKMELDIAEVPVQDIQSEIKSMFSELARSKSIQFQVVSNDATITSLVTDKQRLEQILRNLLSNAFKFTDKQGKVTLTIDKAPANISYRNPRLAIARHIVAFSVADSGIGISQEKQAVVFEAFQQADGSTKRKYGGTGLGLSISRSLANVLGGEIHLQSEEGKGSVFTLYIPLQFDANIMEPSEHRVELKDSPATAKKYTKPVLEPLGDAEAELPDDRYTIQEKDKVVLIMEDDPDFARILLDFVRERKYKGVITLQGNTGLSYARLIKPDAIILDINLPVMDGVEVLRHLKADPELRHIPVQIISGYDRRKEGLELGAFDFLRKPINRDDLKNTFDKIEDFISRKLKKLLVVEDDVQQNQSIRDLIGNKDVKSYSAHSGGEAIKMMSEDHFDCIIVDLVLPDMSGFDLLERIKSNPELVRIPVIVYTAKDLSKEENSRLLRFANTVVLKTANSHERLLDETMLFLHRVEANLPKEKQHMIRKLHKTDEVLRGKKVLVVDDDIRNIYSLTNALEEEGMNCFTAENGREALKVLRENPAVDIVLMDVMMPEMDGYEATREIRRISRFEKMPVIALTAKAMKGDREKCLEAGMSDYVSKPVNMERLLSLMRVWLYT